ncbi:MAG TPA: glycosyltransferase family 4 protein [Thermoanaerobaculia bacterium]|nr:glycosyltransferase family 4 protein [Thermoanaerobaculia bacterium]
MSPTYFAPESFLGGGERFAEELARAMAARAEVAEVKLVSFGPRGLRESPGPGYERVILRSRTRDRMTPFSAGLFRELSGADVIHCHQFFVLPTFLAAAFGRLRGSRVFVSDLGGGGWTPGYQIDQSRWIAAHLPLSEYAARRLHGRNRRHRVIWGGVDPERHPMRPAPTHGGSVVFLGRVLPHKGVHFLIEGLPLGVPLDVIGPATDAAYLERLRELAQGKDVRFRGALSDAEVIEALGRAMALVHPTPVDAAGSAGVHELFGLALVEAMARGCPVIASDAASLPEIVAPGVNGLLVPPNRPEAIREAVLTLREDGDLWARLSAGARRTVEEKFTWDRVVDRCLEAYGA